MAAEPDWPGTFVKEELGGPLFKKLRNAGIMKPDTCDLLLDIIKVIGSKDSERRLVATFQLRQCLMYVQALEETQVYTNMAVLALERGAVNGLASGMREAAAGDWALVLPEKDVNLILKWRARVIVNKALNYAQCLAFLAVDSRCVAHILKEFPDMAKTATATFLVKPNRLGQHTSLFQKQARRAIIRLLNSTMPFSPGCMRKVAGDTAFLKEVMKHAGSIGETFQREDADECTGASTIVFNALLSGASDMQALRSELYLVAEEVLGESMSSDHVDLGIKLLCLILEKDPLILEEDLLKPLPSEYSSLESSLLALLFAVKIPRQTQLFAHIAKQHLWKPSHGSWTFSDVEALYSRFKADTKSLSRAVQLSKMFSNASKELCDIGGIMTPKMSRKREQAGQSRLGSLLELEASPLKPHLGRRKCSQPGCDKVESEAGTFQVCGRCKIAVYCCKGKGLILLGLTPAMKLAVSACVQMLRLQDRQIL